MNVQRAKEIAMSPTMEHVLYNGKLIYIQHVDEQKETARIYPLDNPASEQEVAVVYLKEQKNNIVH